MRKLEIGAGNSRLEPDWETSDIRPGIADYCCPATEIHTLGQFDRLYACMVLEHIPRLMQLSALLSWKAALVAGGILEIIVPDMEYISQLILGGNPGEGIRLAYGDQGYPEDTHVWGFTVKTLNEDLANAGFEVLEVCKLDNNSLYARVQR